MPRTTPANCTTQKPAHLRLVRDAVSMDTVDVLEELLARARKGEIIGIAFAAMRKRRAYIADTAGEASRDPTFARGMLAALDDHLTDVLRGR